jgi:hypothetical protein
MRRSSWTVIASISQLHFDTPFKEFCADISLSENDANSVISELLENQLIFENEVKAKKSQKSFKPVSDLLKGSFSTLAMGMFGHDSQNGNSEVNQHSPTAVRMRIGEFQPLHSSTSALRSLIWESSEQSESRAEASVATSTAPQQARKLSSISAPKGKKSTSSSLQVKGDSAREPEGKRYKLQPIISQIEKLSSGGVEGSVLVYQVFLKVPTELLREEGIESLKLVDANTEFSSQKLCQAIVRATAQITGYNLKIIGYNR